MHDNQLMLMVSSTVHANEARENASWHRSITILKRCGYGDAATIFGDFVVGFNQAAERSATTDAGELKEGVDHKMRGM